MFLLVCGAFIVHAVVLDVAASDAPPYTVSCQQGAASAAACAVDRVTWTGWRTYHSSCNHCHGQDALGGSFAPSMAAGFQRADTYAAFREIVEDGIEGAMPGFAGNPNIGDKIDALYQYLSARANGALPAGRPARFED